MHGWVTGGWVGRAGLRVGWLLCDWLESKNASYRRCPGSCCPGERSKQTKRRLVADLGSLAAARCRR